MNRRANYRPNYKPLEDRAFIAKTKPTAMHRHNAPGSKLIRRFFKNMTGIRGTFEEAMEWWKNYNPQPEKE